jgi:hypothetical protein
VCAARAALAELAAAEQTPALVARGRPAGPADDDSSDAGQRELVGVIAVANERRPTAAARSAGRRSAAGL